MPAVSVRKMEESLRQTLRPAVSRRQNCHTGTCEFGSLQDADFAGETWPIQNPHQWNTVQFCRSHVCFQHVLLQKQDGIVSQQRRSGSDLCRHWLAHVRTCSSRTFGYGCCRFESSRFNKGGGASLHSQQKRTREAGRKSSNAKPVLEQLVTSSKEISDFIGYVPPIAPHTSKRAH